MSITIALMKTIDFKWWPKIFITIETITSSAELATNIVGTTNMLTLRTSPNLWATTTETNTKGCI
jgi:hypothetical protein